MAIFNFLLPELLPTLPADAILDCQWRDWAGLGYFLYTESLAQSKLIVSGIVVDAETLEPLPHAHVLKNHQSGTTPSNSGAFIMGVRHLDTLTVSHVAYHSKSQIIRKPQDSDTITVAVFLERETTLLPALEVTPFPGTLEDFKQEIMELEVKDPVESLRRQQEAITYDITMSPKVSFDSYENFRRINHPTDFILFSSGPNKGIRKALKILGVRRNRK